MSDTMNSMKLVEADMLHPDQLMIGDLIKIGEDIVEVISMNSDSAGDNWFIETKDEFGETETTVFNFNSSIPLYVFIEIIE